MYTAGQSARHSDVRELTLDPTKIPDKQNKL